MGPGRSGDGMRRWTFAAWVGAIVAFIVVQSAAHLVVVLGRDDLHSDLDLDRSNGIPDLVSTAVLAAATVGAAALAAMGRGARRVAAAGAAGLLGALTLADLLHDGAHPSRSSGVLVIGLVAGTFACLALVGVGGSRRTRVVVVVAAVLLATSFLVSGLDRFDQWFERRRGDPVAEYRIVAKEGLELAGWALVALALWDEVHRRRR